MFRRARFATGTAALLALAALSPARAQATHPDFSGTWVLDTTKTQAGPMTPQSLTEAVEQHGDTLKITRTAKTMQGDVSTTVVFGLDGKPWKNSLSQGGMQADMSTVCTWEGATLVISSTVSVAGQEAHQTEKWTLDQTGHTLTSEHNIDMMGQQMSTKLVLNKQ